MGEGPSETWLLTRRFVTEVMAAFIANYPAMLGNHAHPVPPVVGAFVAAAALYSANLTTLINCGAPNK